MKNDKKNISDVQRTGILITLLAAAFITSMSTTATAMALSGLEGKERVDGSAIFNMLRQISSSLASTLSVLIYTLVGSNMTAIHGVYVYYGLVTIAIAVAVILYLKAQTKK